MDDGFENLSVSNLRCTSPEQILGRSPNRVSDIYSFGIVGFFHIIGEFPFDGQYVPETAVAHFNHGSIGKLKLPAGLSGNVLHLIQKCMQVNPDARFASFTQILGSLQRMTAGKRVRLKFERRFTIQRAPFRVGFSPVFMGGAAAIIGLLTFYFLSTGSFFSPPATPTAVESATSALAAPATTQTEKPIVGGPTAAATDPPPAAATSTEVKPSYRLAFEGVEPVILNQVISSANFANLREISRLGYGKPEEAAGTPDNTHVAVATSAGVIIFEGAEFLHWIDPEGWATSVQFSPDGKTLAVGLLTGEIQLWDWLANTKTATLEGHTKKINRILFAQSGLMYSASDDQNIIVWNVKSGKTALPPIRAHSQPVNDIAVTSDGRTLVSCSDDRLIRVWDLASGEKMYELGSRYFSGAIRALAISSDDAYFAAGGESGYMYQWNLLTTPSVSDPLPRPRADNAPVAKRIWSLQYIRDDTEILVGVDDGESVIYEAARKEYEGLSLTFDILPHPLRLVDAFGPGFDFDSFTTFYNETPLSLNWDGQVTSQDTPLTRPRYDVLDRLDFSADGTTLAAGGRRGSTHIWNLTTNESIYEGFYALKPDEPIYEGVYSLPLGDPISPDGLSIVLVVPKSIKTSDRTLTAAFYQLRNLSGTGSNKELTQTIDEAHVGYASNGSIFIAANLKQSKAWDYATGNETNLSGYPYTGCWITASANNLKEPLQVNSAAGIFPPTDDEHLNSLCPKTYQYRGAVSALSHDVSLMAFVNSSGLLEGYDVLAKTSTWPPYRLDSPVTALAISPDGSLIAVGDATGRVLFIDGKTGQLVGEFTGNFGRLEAIEFAENGQKIATAGQDGLVRIFGIVEIQ
jgi:WD40 repeat protein